MFWLHISSPQGVEAEFSVESASLALDLALRSGRAGLHWYAERRDGTDSERLSLEALRDGAVAHAATSDTERRLLDEIEWAHEVANSARFN